MSMPALYRYRPVERALDELRTRCLKFTRPSAFNDPFDFQIPISFGGTREQVAEYIQPKLRKELANRNEQEIARIAAELARSDKVRDFLESLEFTHRQMTALTENLEVLCLSSKPNDILMWSHYADKHLGVCLRFDPGADKMLENARPVSYVPDCPRVNYHNATAAEIAKAVVFSKAAQWGYEEEWRVFRRAGDSPGYHFNPRALTGLIFGLRCRDDTQEKCKELLRDWKSPIVLYEARRHEFSFRLDIAEVARLP